MDAKAEQRGPDSAFERLPAAYQSGRDSPFSIWGQTSLEPLRTAILIAVAVLAIAFAWWPKDKKLFQVAALGAALLIGVQLTMHHWFYLYIAWFYPLLLVAMAVRSPSVGHSAPPQAARPTEGDLTATPT